jgi:hypothetical protein
MVTGILVAFRGCEEFTMASRTWVTTLAIVAMAATPAFAQDQQRRRSRETQREQPRQEQPAERTAPQAQERAVPRTAEPRQDNRQQPRADQARRDEQVRRDDQARQAAPARRDYARQYDARPRYDARPQYNVRPQYDARRGYSPRVYTNSYAVGRRFIEPRFVRPTIIQVVPYRPYIYRPSFSIGVYYGSDGYYPYGYTPRGYFDPIPGRYYGGVRITGAPRDARVFADGYYVGIVDDFDGIFQHINLEAGPHHIEVEDPGFPPIAFDVNVRPGETITFRADSGYFQE